MKKYPLETKPATSNSGDLQLAFDVGHSSIGWAVLQVPPNDLPNLLGCGAVIFQADDCLASRRRGFRRQRRHIRATRLRIGRIKTLLTHLGVLTPAQLDKVSTSSPWFHAARVLVSKGKETLTWPQLWDVLRWYAHNRGYDGNALWSVDDLSESDKSDIEKVENAEALYQKHGTKTMAATFCAELGLDPLGIKASAQSRFKGLNAAFPRADVRREVYEILHAHIGVLDGVDAKLNFTLLQDWRGIPCEDLRLPGRYKGGLLFGQLVPRFENRIIAQCPVTYERIFRSTLKETGDESKARHEAAKQSKVPSRNCPEFFRFRWAMQLANVRIVDGKKTRGLTTDECRVIDAKARERGYFTPKQFKDAVRKHTSGSLDNLDQMMLLPDAQKALLVDPVQTALSMAPFETLFPHLPEPVRKLKRNLLRRGKAKSLGALYCLAWGDFPNRETIGNSPDPTHSPEQNAFDAELLRILEKSQTKRKKGENALTLESLLKSVVAAPSLDGRAPYHRNILREVCDDVMIRGIHPNEENGCLYRDKAIRITQLQRAIDEQSNNHLVRHRLKILERLHLDLLKDFAREDQSRISRITIEVNRDVRDLSGKTAQEVAKDQGQRLANFKSVVKKLETAFEGKGIKIGPGLIRKARIAEDLGWTCPYTGKGYDAFDLYHRRVDLDHIIPRSLRPSDSLDSLVVTFSEVNKMKGKRTAAQFIEELQSQPVSGLPQLHLKPLTQFIKDVEALESFKGHDDDKRRKKNRKRLLQVRDYVEKEFTPGDLTKTSQLVRLGAQVLQKHYLDAKQPPVITSLPGAVTGSVRKSWRLLGCLGAANSAITEETTKTEVRGITHLHHALDASVLAFGSYFLPRDGGVWELLIKRNLAEGEQKHLLNIGTIFQRDASGRVSLADLPSTLKAQIRQRLAERRVVQHMPSDLSGLSSKETVWRVFDPADPHLNSKRLGRWLSEANISIPAPDAPTALIICRKRRADSDDDGSGGKTLRQTKTWQWVYDIKAKGALLGLAPEGDLAHAKLKKIKAVKVLGDNFGIALDPVPTLIRPHKIWHQLRALHKANEGKPVRVIRKGTIVRIPSDAPNERYRGIWMIRGTTLNQRAGFLVDMSPPDQILYRRRKGCLENVSLSTLIKYRLEVIKSSFTGEPFV